MRIRYARTKTVRVRDKTVPALVFIFMILDNGDVKSAHMSKNMKRTNAQSERFDSHARQLVRTKTQAFQRVVRRSS